MSTTEGIAGHAKRGGIATVASQLIKFAIMLLGTAILARLLAPEQYGLVAMTVAIVGIADVFRDFGLSMAAIQAKSLSKAQASNLFWLNAAVGTALGIVVFLAAGPIAAFYGQPLLVSICQQIAVVFVLGGLTTQFKAQMNRNLRFVSLALQDVLAYGAGVGVAIVVALITQDYHALVWQQVSAAAISLVVAVALARWWPSWPSRRAEMRGLLTFGASFAGTQLIAYATRNLDSVAIGRFWGPTTLGFYDRAYALLMIPINQISTPLSRVAVPLLSRSSHDDDVYMRRLRQAQLLGTYGVASIFLVLSALSPAVVAVLLGPQWAESASILTVLCVGGVFRALGQIPYWVFVSRGLAAQQFRFYLVTQPVVIVVMLCGLPWGALGVAIGYSTGYALFWFASMFWAGRCAALPVTSLIGSALKPLCLYGIPLWLAAYGASFWLSNPLLALLAGLAGASAWTALALLIPSVRRDARSLAQFARRRGR